MFHYVFFPVHWTFDGKAVHIDVQPFLPGRPGRNGWRVRFTSRPDRSQRQRRTDSRILHVLQKGPPTGTAKCLEI